MTDKPAPVTLVLHLSDARDRAASRLEATDGKSNKTAVDYRASYGMAKCGLCVHGEFDPGENVGACSKVAGTIRYSMSCNLFNSRRAASDDTSDRDPS